MKIISKIRRKVWSIIVQKLRGKVVYPFLYRSYWHYLLNPNVRTQSQDYPFLTARPNPDAGIGHQLANWISGYWWSSHFSLHFAHVPFSNPMWDFFLGFGENEVKLSDLLKFGYKRVRLPLFSEFNSEEMKMVQGIIRSYGNSKVVFVCELDQFYKAQFQVSSNIQEKFFSSPARKDDKLIFNKENFNIAIHVRRGDIAIGQINKNPNLLMRWQNNDYFVNTLRNTLSSLETKKQIFIYIFSQGEDNDFEEFKEFPNLVLCLKMNAIDSFLHMVNADVLITSKSSFSYKPALLNKGIKICPNNFWHYYPDTSDWILADEEGNLVRC